MSVQSQIDRISGAVSDIVDALTEKGVTVPNGTKVDGLAALIAAIEAGGGGSGGGGEVTAFKKGSITFASSTVIGTTDPYTIPHGLGEQPDFAIIGCPGGAAGSNYILWFGLFCRKVSNSSQHEHNWIRFAAFAGSSTTYNVTCIPSRGGQASSTKGFDADEINLNIYASNSNHRLYQTYYWVAGCYK